MSVDDTLMCSFQILKPAEKKPLKLSIGSKTARPGSSPGMSMFGNSTTVKPGNPGVKPFLGAR
uniref:Uncharacterized protein n=1 Tax=Kalanchoe fedtschenkoi TaxID=63787 RepID=A0A7N0UG82_KALFE